MVIKCYNNVKINIYQGKYYIKKYIILSVDSPLMLWNHYVQTYY